MLAVFVAVPPLFQTIKLLPQLARWFINLAWVRRITGRPRSKLAQDTGILMGEVMHGRDNTHPGWKSVTTIDPEDAPARKYGPPPKPNNNDSVISL